MHLLWAFSFDLMAPKLGILFALIAGGIISLMGLLLWLKWLDILLSESKVLGVFYIAKVFLLSPNLGSLDFTEALY